MVEATIVLTHTLAPAALLPALAEQAAFVLEAPRASIELFGDNRSTAEYGRSPTDPVCISRPLVGHLGDEIGRLTVERPKGVPFAADDGAVVTMLAESASVASRNAHLYQDARIGSSGCKRSSKRPPRHSRDRERRDGPRGEPGCRALFPVSSSEATELVHIPAELVDPLADLVSATVAGERCEVELTTTDAAGDRRDLLVSTAPVSGEGLGVMRMLAVVTDMTGRKRLEDQLAKAQRFEAIATLAGGVAHDFNNLLTVILGYSEILLHGLAADAPDREPVEAIQEAGKHARGHHQPTAHAEPAPDAAARDHRRRRPL